MLHLYSQDVFLTVLKCPLLLTQQQTDCLPGVQEGLHAAVTGAMEAGQTWSNTHLDCTRGAQASKSPIQPEAGCEAMQTGCLQDTSTAAADGVMVNWRRE